MGKSAYSYCMPCMHGQGGGRAAGTCSVGPVGGKALRDGNMGGVGGGGGGPGCFLILLSHTFILILHLNE